MRGKETIVCDILNESSIGQQPHMRWLDKHKEQPE